MTPMTKRLTPWGLPYPARQDFRILLSYWAIRNMDVVTIFAKHLTRPYPALFVDSGAFSAMTQGVVIDWRAYRDYIIAHRELMTVYANLDVIRNPEATWANQQRLEDAGLFPLPVWHVGESWAWLEHYLERYTYIAIGGMVGYRLPVLMPWLVRAFKMARQCTAPHPVFHGFGMTTWACLKTLPWFSVDSSSWGSAFRYGEMPLFDPQRGVWLRSRIGDRRRVMQHANLIRAYGYDPADFADRTRNTRHINCGLAAYATLMAQEWLRRHHGSVPLPPCPQWLQRTASGINQFLVDASLDNLASAQQGIITFLVDTDGGDAARAQQALLRPCLAGNDYDAYLYVDQSLFPREPSCASSSSSPVD